MQSVLEWLHALSFRKVFTYSYDFLKMKLTFPLAKLEAREVKLYFRAIYNGCTFPKIVLSYQILISHRKSFSFFWDLCPELLPCKPELWKLCCVGFLWVWVDALWRQAVRIGAPVLLRITSSELWWPKRQRDDVICLSDCVYNTAQWQKGREKLIPRRNVREETESCYTVSFLTIDDSSFHFLVFSIHFLLFVCKYFGLWMSTHASSVNLTPYF